MLINPAAEPFTKVWDVRHVCFEAPDLDVMEKFCLDFGMLTLSKSGSQLIMRGFGDDAAVHITRKAATAAFVGLAFDVASKEALETYAAKTGLAVKDYAGPGGGLVVNIVSPEGFQVELLWGGKKNEIIQQTVANIPSNFAVDRPSNYEGNKRVGYVKRVNQEAGERGNFTPFDSQDRNAHDVDFANTPGPSHVMRLGHVVLGVKDFRESEAWWKQHFGLVTSDEIHAPKREDRVIGAFMRCDRGEHYTDHHTIFMIGNGKGPAFNHAAFEVASMDDLFCGNSYLRDGSDYHHSWGIGRHINGSQIFDYWHDPYGHQMEHWTDGDQLNLHNGSNKADVRALMASQLYTSTSTPSGGRRMEGEARWRHFQKPEPKPKSKRGCELGLVPPTCPLPETATPPPPGAVT